MVISDHNIIFVHIPKTGGTSVINALLREIHGEDFECTVVSYLPDELQKQYLFHGARKHWTSQQIKSHVGGDLWDASYKFATVRNPWDRVVSEYHWIKQIFSNLNHPYHEGKKLNNINIRKQKIGSFDQFVETLSSVYQRKKHFFYNHNRPQTDYLIDEHGNWLVDDVFNIEDMHMVAEQVRKNTGLNINIGKENKTEHKQYQSYYTEDLYNIVANIYREDIKQFGFKF